MTQYRKLPVVINAWDVKDLIKGFSADFWPGVPKAIVDAYDNGVIRVVLDAGLTVSTLEGLMDATFNDMLIQGVNGELYPCKKEIFNKTYEAV